MRIDPPGSQLRARYREPRIVIGVIYDTLSIYMTSRTGIANVPGEVIEACLRDVSSSSQQLFPDEGRATIGSLTFTAVDLDGSLSEAIREQLLTLNRGIRNCEVRVYTGDGDDFNDYVRIDTYVVDEAVELDQGLYSFSCSDRVRELREEVFQQVGTRLTVSLANADTTLNVQSTAGFVAVHHTAAFEDAPSATVGYVRIRKTGEIIRWTGKTTTTFTGCTRQCFRSVADVVAIEMGTADDKLPEVEEFIYIEGPIPQVIYAVMTGTILGTTDTLPDPWHLGVDPANIDEDSFLDIGTDLFDPDDFTKGLHVAFPYLQQTDGKRFIEEQLNRVGLTFLAVDTFGRLKLRRMAALISAASPAAVIGYESIISHGAIRHDQSRVINEVVMDWNYNGENYTRTDVLVNANSIQTYRRGTRVNLELGGLKASKHGLSTLQHIMDSYTDRYGAPPIMLTLNASSTMNHLEIGDCVRVQLPRLPDFSDAATLDRVFEIQSRAWNPVTGELRFDLFASTSRVEPDNRGGDSSYLPDAWYSSEGTALSSVLTMVGDHVTASGSLTGAADMRDAVFYHVGDVIIDSGVTVLISDNVQIRCTGELQVIGKIDGKGRGRPAVADTNVVGLTLASFDSRLRQTIGSTQGSSGIWALSTETIEFNSTPIIGVASTSRYALVVKDSALEGLPSELRGTEGIWAVGVLGVGSMIVRALGGAGGAGGAGLMLVSRGLTFGLSGRIDLSGNDGSVGGNVTLAGHSLNGGGGGGGAAGQFLVVLDGDQITFPDLVGFFIANHGVTPQSGTLISRAPPDTGAEPWCGAFAGLGTFDNAAASAIVQYLMPDVALGDNEDELLPPPTGLAAVADGAGLTLSWAPPAPEKYDYVEVWEAISNDRTGAVRVAQVRGDHLVRTSDTSITRYYWARSVKGQFGWSTWDPVDALDGVAATFGGATGENTVIYQIQPITGTALKNSASTLQIEAHKIDGGTDVHLSTGTIKLYVGSTVVTVANGYGVGSDGYTGVFDASDIGGSVIVELKDGPGGTVLDSITLVDVLDGTAASTAVYGYVEATAPLAWTRASDQTTWTPSATTVDLCATFIQGLTNMARIARRITRDANGLLTASTVAHPSGDLNTGNVTVTILGSGTQSLTVKYDYDDGSNLASVAEGVITSMAGVDGTDGFPGSDSGGMIQNSGFEVGALLPGWATTGVQAVVVNDLTKAHSGTWSVHVGTGSTGVRTAPTYRPAVVVGQTLVASGFVARDPSSLPDADAELYIRWEDSAGALIGTSASTLASHTTVGYQTLRVEAAAPVGATHAVLVFSKSAGSSGLYYADDFSLQTKGDAGTDGPECVITANITRSGRTFTKTGNDGAWNESARSTQGYDACSVTWKAGTTNKRFMVALNSDPTTDSSYTSLDFAVYHRETGQVEIYESSALILATGLSYTTSTEFEIRYDGQTLKYLMDGVLLRAVTKVGARLYFDSSFYDSGAQLTALSFGGIGVNFAVADEIRDDFAYQSVADLLRHYRDANGAGELTLLTGLTDSPAGTALRVGNNSGNDQRWLEKLELMPYDGVSLYEMGIIARKGLGGGAMYAGVDGIAADGVTLINGAGANTESAQHDIAAAGVVLGSSWTMYKGYVRGWANPTLAGNNNDSSNPGHMYPGVAYVRPVFLVNYNGNSGQTDVAAIWVRRLGASLAGKDKADTNEITPAAATEVYSTHSASPGAPTVAGGYDYFKFFVEQNGSRTYGSQQVIPQTSLPFAMNDVIALVSGYTITVGLAVHRTPSGTFTDLMTITSIPAPADSSQSMVLNVAGANLYEFTPDSGLSYAMVGVDVTLQAVKVKR